ncbi:unnamed protein product [Amoebophrya sp. A25]|nr:unnamed protein product [Amoebophrya sp. A25]|eukprot:GSA25T00000870001.1
MGNSHCYGHYYACACFGADEIAAKETWGEFKGFAEPGFHCFPIPCVYNTNDMIATTRLQFHTTNCETKTRDQVFVELAVQLQYRVNTDDPYNVFYRVDSIEDKLSSFVKDIIRAQIPTMDLDEVFTDSVRVKKDMRERMNPVLAGFGYQLVDTLIVDLKPNRVVAASMNEIQAEQRLRVAAYDRAEAQKIMTVIQGEAEAEAKFLHGKATASMRKAIIDGLKSSFTDFEANLVAKNESVSRHQVMDLLLIIQYFDYLAEVGGGKFSTKPESKIGEVSFLYHNPGAMADMRKIIQNYIQKGADEPAV